MSGILRKTLHSYSNVTKKSFLNSSTLSKINSKSQLTLSTTGILEDKPSEEDSQTDGPPSLPSTCCMSGCANCVWLDFAEETVNYYEAMGEKMEFTTLLKQVEKNIDDPMIKAFITMELKSKYLFKKS